MFQFLYRQNLTIHDLSKKARPPPGIIPPMNMNYQIIYILFTIPLRLSAFFGRAHFAFSKLF